MPFLLDTNIVSETIRANPEPRVLAWLGRQIPAELFLASQTIGELVRGTRKAKDKARRDRLERWILDDLSQQFENRILPFDDAAARIWGHLMGDADRKGQTLPAADTRIAAVAIDHGLILVTRNVKDFGRFDLRLANPWQFEP